MLTEQWVPWSADNDVDFDFIQKTGAGSGEAKLARELNAKVMGGNVSYDLLTEDKKIWEVKDIRRGSEIRLGVEDTEQVINFWTEAIIVCRQVEQFYNHSGSVEWFYENNTAKEDVEYFLSNTKKSIMRGELSKGAILGNTPKNKVGLKQVCSTLSSCKTDRVLNSTSANGVDYTVNYDMFVGFLSDNNVDLDTLNIPCLDVARSVLRHSFIADDNTLTEAWASVSRASVAFSRVDGLIVVKSKGYFVVPREKLDDYFKFERISQRTSRYKFVEKCGV